MKKWLLKGEPAPEVVSRVVRTLTRTGLVGLVEGGLEVAQIAATRGLDVRTIHAVHAATHPERIALIDGDVWMTFEEVDRRINQTARLLKSVGVERGTRVMICMENRAEYLLTWFASFRLGASAIHASYRSTVNELEYLFEHSGARVCVTSGATADAVIGGGKHLGVRVICTELHDGCASFARAETFSAAALPHAEADGASVVYTSGTTGKPKGAVRNFTSFGLVELSRLLDRMPIDHATRHLVVCPLYHSAAQAFVLIHAAVGAPIVVQRQFDPVATLDLMDRLRVGSTFLVPTMIQRLLSVCDARTRPPALKCLVSGAAPFPDALRREAIGFFGAPNVFDFYGATELGWVTLIDGLEMIKKPGSVGRALPGQTIEIRTQGQRLGPREIGTIWVANEQIMAGYLHESGSGRDAGYLTVDDLGYLDEENYLFLSGRDRDMVISGGVNVYPVEIEEMLLRHPGIEDVAVLGVPDPEWGERLVAFLVGEIPAGIEAWLKDRLSGPKIPREWILIDELPRNPTGKVLKRELRERVS